jgi:hypothetical protein
VPRTQPGCSKTGTGGWAGCQFDALGARAVVPGGWSHPTGWWGQSIHPQSHRELPGTRADHMAAGQQHIRRGAVNKKATGGTPSWRNFVWPGPLIYITTGYTSSFNSQQSRSCHLGAPLTSGGVVRTGAGVGLGPSRFLLAGRSARCSDRHRQGGARGGLRSWACGCGAAEAKSRLKS